MRGTVSAHEVEDKAGRRLVDSFEEMLAANGIAPPPRNRWTPRAEDEQGESG